jgi:hypothetical protein
MVPLANVTFDSIRSSNGGPETMPHVQGVIGHFSMLGASDILLRAIGPGDFLRPRKPFAQYKIIVESGTDVVRGDFIVKLKDITGSPWTNDVSNQTWRVVNSYDSTRPVPQRTLYIAK